MAIDPGPKLLQEWIGRAAARHPDKPWIVSTDDGRTVNYGQLRDATRRIATLLRQYGLGRNDRVALLANNSIEHLVCYLGVMAYGAAICTVHVEMNRNQLDDIFARLRPKLVLYQDGLELNDLLDAVTAPKMRLGPWDALAADTFFGKSMGCAPSDACTDAGPADDAVILFTSGTSAKPKGVVLSYREHLLNIDPTADGFGITADDRLYDFRSFNWASAQLLGALVPVNRGATLVMGQKFSASRFFPHVREHGVTIAAGNPTTINILLNADGEAHHDNLPSLRFLTSSSAPLTVEEWRRFEQRFGIPVAQGYGSSETGWIAAIPGEARRHGTVGQPFAYHHVAIVDGNGRLAPGAIGQVEIGGFGNHHYRYLTEDGRVAVSCSGRMLTGDLGLIDEDGYLRVTGRAKDLIIRGGVNISPLEIDSFLMQHPSLIEVATVGVPDAVYGEEVVSYVVARPGGGGVDAATLLRYCSDGLPAFKAPKRIVLMASLPKTERGKLDRRALAEQWRRETGG
jgi:acyl-coenzyme A synthetase/AMP-(fatty) acid ligase